MLLEAVQFRAVSLGHFELFGESLKTNHEMKNFARKAGFAFTLARGAVRQEIVGLSPDWNDDGNPVVVAAGHSATISPDPPNSPGKSFNLGSPSGIGSTVSA